MAVPVPTIPTQPKRQQMKLTTTYSYSLNSTRCNLEIYCGNILAHDGSNETINLFVGDDALNEGITQYLKKCSRQEQEAFIQALNDHIRKTDNAEA